MSQERLLKVILSPHISEKSTRAAERSEYVFKITKCATKSEVKDAVEFLFNKKVDAVRIVNVGPKKKLFKGVEGSRKGWKKAYVTLQSGQTLEIAGAQ